MKITVAIPTLNRKEKLSRCLNSIFHAVKKDNVFVDLYFSDEFNYTHFTHLRAIPNISLTILDKYSASKFWNMCLKKLNGSDVLVYLNDDVEVFPDFFDKLEERFTQLFPDFDGVLGINQANLPDGSKLESAFGAIGKKYAERFPDRQVWCPEYKRFYGDKELMFYALPIGKFQFCHDIKINHYHCDFTGERDTTHDNVRTHLSNDKQTFLKRQELGFLWGQNFNLVGS